MTLDELLHAATTDESALVIPKHWSQGRTVYGGLSMALAYARMRQRIEPERLLRAINGSFIGPVAFAEPVDIKVEVLREGKSLSQLQATVSQHGKTCSLIQATFGKSLPSEAVVTDHPIPEFTTANDQLTELYLPGITPDFLENIEVQIAEGDIPCAGSSKRELGGWMRFRNPPAVFTEAHLIAIIDAWPPTTLPMTKTLAPASTVDWQLNLMQPAPVIKPDEYLGYRATIRYSKDGFGYTEACIWNQNNELLALSNQTVLTYG